ncbi:MAG: methyltransferase domain-containing protein [Alphaproteobacteria bacterium]|nr:methyltransferase domain-containing protein [Alphaproteobacteria bacterium]
MDYDKTDMPERYDRGRTMQPGMLAMWLDRIAFHLSTNRIENILDLGCGTGRFTDPLASRFGATATGVDPSERMLTAARAKEHGPRVSFRKGSAEATPVPDASIDLVFISMAFHHFPDPAKAVRETHRVLRRDGHVFLRNSTAEQRSPYAPFFPGYQEMADQILPTADRIRSAFEKGGFRTTAHELVPHKMAPDWVDLAEKAAVRADSILLRLPDASFAEGIAAMRAQAPSAPDEFVGLNVDLFVFAKT